MQKHEWKKSEKNIYLPGSSPEIVTIPEYQFVMIDGSGNPNSDEFARKVAALYAISYTIKMLPKKGFLPEGYFDYAVYPLEGVWDLSDEGKKSSVLCKDELIYTVMIRQPDFVNNDVFSIALNTASKRIDTGLAGLLRFSKFKEGLSVQMLHTGPYEDEPSSFLRMKIFTEQNNLKRLSMQHREIYLTDARKTEPAKQTTVLRYMVKPIQ